MKDASVKDENIISTRIRVGRNLADFPLGTNISKEQRDEAERQIVEALKSLTCKGRYYSLESMSEEDRNLLKSIFYLKRDIVFLR